MKALVWVGRGVGYVVLTAGLVVLMAAGLAAGTVGP